MTKKSIEIKRGEVWWARLDPTESSEIRKTRPVVVVTHDVLNANRRTVIVVPCSTKALVAPPLTVAVTISGKKGAAVIDQLRAIGKHRLNSRIGVLGADELANIETAIGQILSL